MLTYDNIRKMTDPRTFEKGRQIRHSKNKILDFNVQTERRYRQAYPCQVICWSCQ